MKKAMIGLALTAVVALAGCGGGGGSSSGGAAKDLGTLELGPGFKFNPTSLAISGPGTYKIKLVNKDTQVHDFAIEGTSVKKEVAPGKEEVYEFKLDKSGPYKIVCTQPGHKEAGMAFEVK